MSELSERICRNATPNLDGWMRRLLIEAADKLDSVALRLGGLEEDPEELAKKRMSELLAYEHNNLRTGRE